MSAFTVISKDSEAAGGGRSYITAVDRRIITQLLKQGLSEGGTKTKQYKIEDHGDGTATVKDWSRYRGGYGEPVKWHFGQTIKIRINKMKNPKVYKSKTDEAVSIMVKGSEVPEVSIHDNGVVLIYLRNKAGRFKIITATGNKNNFEDARKFFNL